MSKKQSAWCFFGVVVFLILVFVFITIRLCVKYGDQIPWRIFAILLIIPGLPIIIWALVAICLYCLLKVAVIDLIKIYDTYNMFNSK
ncbi:MAG: hypothetical protein ACFWTQ_00420 [Lactococcus sp.]|jgi:hypothetical protein